MQEFNINIKISKDEMITERVATGTLFASLAEKYQERYKDRIVLVSVDNKLRELNKEVEADGTLSFVTMTERDGKRAYRVQAHP